MSSSPKNERNPTMAQMVNKYDKMYSNNSDLLLKFQVNDDTLQNTINDDKLSFQKVSYKRNKRRNFNFKNETNNTLNFKNDLISEINFSKDNNFRKYWLSVESLKPYCVRNDGVHLIEDEIHP